MGDEFKCDDCGVVGEDAAEFVINSDCTLCLSCAEIRAEAEEVLDSDLMELDPTDAVPPTA